MLKARLLLTTLPVGLAMGAIITAIVLADAGFVGVALATPLLLILLGVALCASYERGVRLPLNPVSVPLSLFWLWTGVSVFFSPVEYVSLMGFFLVGSLPLAFWLYTWLPDPERFWRGFMLVLIGLSLVLVSVSLYQNLIAHMRPEPVFLIAHLRPESFFVQPNTNAAFLNLIALPLSAYFLLKAKAERRSIRLLLLGLLLFCLYYAIAATLSRGALLGFWAGIAVLMLSAVRRVPAKYPIILLVVALAANGLANLQSRGALTGRFDSALGSMQVLMDPSDGLSESGGSIHERSVIWRASAELLRDAPWYGLGPSAFGLAYPAYSPVEDHSSLQYVHNDYLQFWIELGYPGVLLLLWLGLSAVWMFLKVIRSNDVADERRIEAAGLFAGMFAVAAHSVFTYNFNILAIAILFGFVLGRFVALAPTADARTWCAKPTAILGKNAFYALSIIALMFPVSLLASFGAMDHFYTKAKAALIAGDLGLAEQSLTRAEQLFDTSDIQYARAVLYMDAIHALPGSDSARRKQFYELASGTLERAEAVNPYESNVNFGRAMLYQDNPQLAGSQWFARASAAYQKTLDMDPRHYPARLAYAKLLAGNAEERNALALLEAGLAYSFPDDPQILTYARYLAELRRAQSDVEGAERIERWIRVWEQYWRDEAAKRYFSSR